MNLRIKIWHVVLLILVFLLILRFSLLVNTVILMYYYILFLFRDFSAALNQLNIELADYFISLIFILITPVFLLLYRKKLFFNNNLNFNSCIIIILLSFFIFAPLITGMNPEFQKDLGVTKLLSPLSSVKIIHLKNNATKPGDNFFEKRNKVIKSSFDDNLAFADSVNFNGGLIYFQKERDIHIEKEKLQLKDGLPVIETKYYILGTDEYGRDVFSRLVYGARVSLFVGLGAVIITLVLGLVLGFIAGYSGGLTDTVISRISDMFLSFPIIFLIILILALFGNSLLTVILVLGYSGWMGLFKIVRGEVISIKQKEYFISARLAGLSGKDLLLKEIFPVILAPLVVNLVFQYGNVILAESALSYLGLGTGGTYPSWGGMIESGQEYLTEAWWMIFFPGLALFITLFTANNLGKEINLYFNPRLGQ